jgi:AcrR family transcriptional regulator
VTADAASQGNAGRGSRRAEYAETTRRAIIEAARRLFSQKGYFATKVDDIAAAARVAPATVYAATGGKHGLLRTLIDEATTAPIVAAYADRIAQARDPDEVLAAVSDTNRSMLQDWGDVMGVMLSTAPHDGAAAEALDVASARYRAALAAAAGRLSSLGALRDGIDAAEALDILWFYFGYAALSTLVEDNGWPYDKAEAWLRAAASQVLLR